MPRSARTALASALVLAACAATPETPETPEEAVDAHGGHAEASGAPGTPHPPAPEGADGTIELEDEFATGGSGVSVAQALEAASSQPILVSGILLRDAEGGLWFCDDLVAASPPECGRPRIWLTNARDDMPVFDAENAADIGAQTEDGVTWIPDQFVFGIVHPAP